VSGNAGNFAPTPLIPFEGGQDNWLLRILLISFSANTYASPQPDFRKEVSQRRTLLFFFIGFFNKAVALARWASSEPADLLWGLV